MQRINPNETVTCVHDDGGTMVLKKNVTKNQWQLFEELVQAEGTKQMKRIAEAGDSFVKAGLEKANEDKTDKSDDDEEDYLADFSSAAADVFKLKASVVSIQIGDDTITGEDEIEQLYLNELTATSTNWIDEQIRDIWRQSEVGAAEKKARRGSTSRSSKIAPAKN